MFFCAIYGKFTSMLQFLDETIDNQITFIFNSVSRSRDSVFAQHISANLLKT